MMRIILLAVGLVGAMACHDDRAGAVAMSDASAGPSSVPAVLARGRGLRVESISEDGAWIAYSTDGSDARQVWVVARHGGATRAVGRGTARFAHGTLLVFGPTIDPDWSETLAVWRPDLARAEVVARDVDPGATSVSSDGRWLVTEADDRQDDDAAAVAVTLIDLATLAPRVVGRLGKARARFTPDARRLLVGGEAAPFSPCWPSRAPQALTLATGEVRGLGCYQRRFEASAAAPWVVRLDSDGRLLHGGLDASADATLASGVSRPWGKPFDVADDGHAVAFVDAGAPAAPRGVWVVPTAGGPPRRLADGVDLVEFGEQVVLYHPARTAAHAPVAAIDPAGGPSIALGEVDLIAERAGRLVARQRASGALLLLTVPPRRAAVALPGPVAAAVIVDAHRLIVQRGERLIAVRLDAAGAAIAERAVVDRVVGGFAVGDGWIAAAVAADDAGGDALVVGAVVD